MIRMIRNYIENPPPIPPAYIDGALYCAVAWFIFSQSYLGGDEAAKYISPAIKFWINYIVGSAAAIIGALKMFRSTAFADHKAEVKQAVVNNESETKV